jgi:hypothetical protein
MRLSTKADIIADSWKLASLAQAQRWYTEEAPAILEGSTAIAHFRIEPVAGEEGAVEVIMRWCEDTCNAIAKILRTLKSEINDDARGSLVINRKARKALIELTRDVEETKGGDGSMIEAVATVIAMKIEHYRRTTLCAADCVQELQKKGLLRVSSQPKEEPRDSDRP